MSVLASRVRERSFKMVLGGADSESVRAALDAAATAFEKLESEVGLLRQQYAEALRQIDRMAELERSLLRSCVAAEEDARIRCGAARRYATRVIAAAQEQAAARLETPARERDAIAREIDAIIGRRRQAAEGLEALIARLEPAAEIDQGAVATGEETRSEVLPGVSAGGAMSETAGVEFDDIPAPVWPPAAAATVRESLPSKGDRNDVSLSQAAIVESPGPGRNQPQPGDAGLNREGTDTGTDDREDAWAPDAAAVTLPEHARPRRSGRFRVPLAAGSAAAMLLVLQGSTGMRRVPGPPPAIAAASFAPAPAASDAPQQARTPVGGNQAAGASPVGAAQPDAPAATGLTIRIKPLRKCWVRVVVDDRTDARELQPTEDIVLQAQRSIVLRIGDAGALSVEVNGRVLPPLGLDGQVVERRFTAAAATK